MSIKNKLESSNSSEEDDKSDPKIDVILPMNVAFADTVNYRTYRLHNRFRKYNGKMAVRSAELAKRRKTIEKPYKFGDSDPVTTSSLLGQFKRVCDSNGVSEGVVMWLPLFFTAKFLDASLTIRIAPRKDNRDNLNGRRGVKEQECI